jgi:hypothetical protein
MPADDPKQKNNADEHAYRWLEIAVPLLSFGGALLGILLWVSDAAVDIRVSIVGCILASWVLAYLAWIRPKKDIVALTTPIYSFIFIAVPNDPYSTIVLELLYAASLTILLVRLKYRFGRPGLAISELKELADPLKTYVGQTKGICEGISPKSSHQATLAFVMFAQGEYRASANASGTAAGEMEEAGNNSCLTQAFKIVREHADLLDRSLPRPQTFLTFPPEDAHLLAKPVPVSHGDEQEFYAALDNALLLVFSAAWNNSGPDRSHLLSSQGFALKLMSS